MKAVRLGTGHGRQLPALAILATVTFAAAVLPGGTPAAATQSPPATPVLTVTPGDTYLKLTWTAAGTYDG